MNGNGFSTAPTWGPVTHIRLEIYDDWDKELIESNLVVSEKMTAYAAILNEYGYIDPEQNGKVYRLSRMGYYNDRVVAYVINVPPVGDPE